MLLLARIGPRVHPPTALDGWGSAAISLRGRREATQLRGPPPLNLLAQAARQRTWLLPHVRSAPGVFASRVAEVLTPSIPGHPGFRAEGGVMGRRLGVAGVGCGRRGGEGAEEGTGRGQRHPPCAAAWDFLKMRILENVKRGLRLALVAPISLRCIVSFRTV